MADSDTGDTITLTVRMTGEWTVTVNRADYEQAKLDGDVDEFLDADLSDLDPDTTVVEPDGRSYDPHQEFHGPAEPPRT